METLSRGLKNIVIGGMLCFLSFTLKTTYFKNVEQTKQINTLLNAILNIQTCLGILFILLGLIFLFLYVKEDKELELEIKKQLQESNESKNIDDDNPFEDDDNPFEDDNNQEKVTSEKIQPKYETKHQMVKCPFCGRKKEMGSICKRCKTY